MNIMDQLARRISELKNPTVAGLDTRIEYLPEKFVQAILPEGIRSFEDAAEAVYQYNVRLVDALCDIVPAVKVQVAYYEMYGVAGMAAFEKTMAYAKSKGMIVMADVKRNDIGATAACYANAYVGKTPMPYGEEKAFSADIATINPYLGVDGIKPFTEACAANGTGVFALVKTSNPSSGQLQDMRYEDGRTLYEAVADLVEEWGESTRGDSGYSAVGAVVGATYPQQAPRCARACRIPSSSCRATARRARPARTSPAALTKAATAQSSTRPAPSSAPGRSARACRLTWRPATRRCACARICAAA